MQGMTSHGEGVQNETEESSGLSPRAYQHGDVRQKTNRRQAENEGEDSENRKGKVRISVVIAVERKN